MHLKSFTLITLVILSYSAFSQSLTLTYHSNLVNPDSIYCTSFKASKTVSDSVTVNNISGITVEVLVKKVIIDTLKGSMNNFCWGKLCYPPQVYNCPDTVAIQSKSSCSKFFPEYNPCKNVGTSTIRYVFYNKHNKKDTTCITISYISTPDAGIINLDNSSFSFNCYPNPVTNQLNINYSISYELKSNNKLVIYNLNGQKVSEIILSNPKGKVTFNTSALPDGIYLCSLVSQDKIYPLRKFNVIR